LENWIFEVVALDRYNSFYSVPGLKSSSSYTRGFTIGSRG